jgi:hypothetical protein
MPFKTVQLYSSFTVAAVSPDSTEEEEKKTIQ